MHYLANGYRFNLPPPPKKKINKNTGKICVQKNI